jgi:hypothetical protein
VRASGR